MGDFNIDIKKENSIAYNKLEEFCDTFNLTNLAKTETCFMNNHKSTIDLILTNKPHSFQITNVFFLFLFYLLYFNLVCT